MSAIKLSGIKTAPSEVSSASTRDGAASAPGSRAPSGKRAKPSSCKPSGSVNADGSNTGAISPPLCESGTATLCRP